MRAEAGILFSLLCVILAWVIGEGYHALRRRVLKHRGYYLIEAAPVPDERSSIQEFKRIMSKG